MAQTSRLLYLRFHSRNKAHWYEDGKDRYDYLYTDAELQEWIDGLVSKQGLADRALVLFNNCLDGQAAVNAQRMRELITKQGPQFKVISPFAIKPEMEQSLLFEPPLDNSSP